MQDTYTEKRDAFYNYLKANKTILLSVDPGYDAFKIYVNGQPYTCKSITVESDNAGGNLNVKGGAVVQLQDNSTGSYHNYVVGAGALRLISDGDDTINYTQRMQLTYSDSKRFSTESFRAAFYGAVLFALYEYSHSENAVDFTEADMNRLGDWKFALIVTVPYAYASEAHNNVARLLKEPVKAAVQLSKNFSVRLNSPLNFEMVYFQPQVLASFRGKYFTDYGEGVDAAGSERLDETLPALIIDAGYHTCALVEINEMYMVREGRSDVEEESYAMEHFDELTARKLAELYGTRISAEKLAPALVNDYCSGKRKLYAKKADGSIGNEVVDVSMVREEVLNSEKERLVDYLQRKYRMDNYKGAYITGGTGKGILFDYLKGVLGNWQNIEFVESINGYANGEDVGSVYGVAGGAYNLLTALYANEKEEM